MNFISATLIMTACLHYCSGSAIPMWEFLTRDEKMSHLYTTFANQVSNYCKTNTDIRAKSIAICKRDLLTFGLEQLREMPDADLDSLDPFQRDANELIWNTIVKNHPIMKYDQVNNPLKSTIILAHNGKNGFQKNPLFDNIDEVSSNSKQSSSEENTGIETNYNRKYSTIDDRIFEESQNNLESASKYNFHYSEEIPENNYLSGPMVIRVRLDGTPVEEDKWKPKPKDDDHDFLNIGRKNLPSIDDILRSINEGQRHTYFRRNYRSSSRH